MSFPKCKICNQSTFEIFNELVLRKYNVKYYKCKSCDFLQTESPFWLNEAYESAITNQDVGLLYRNNLYSSIISCLIKLFFNPSSKFLDYGGGYGVFVRLMRDNGFNFYRYDTYCENLFSKNFDDSNDTQYELITAFEVFEHLTDPLLEVEKMLKKSDTIFISTELQPDNFSNLNDWWYIMPETGQHISFFTQKSFQAIADKYGLNFYSNGRNLHLLTNKKINNLFFHLFSKRIFAKIFNLLFKHPPSLMMDDYKKSILND